MIHALAVNLKMVPRRMLALEYLDELEVNAFQRYERCEYRYRDGLPR